MLTTRTEEDDFGRELFQLLVETVEDYGIFAMNTHGEIVHWNAGAARTLGYDSEEVLGKRFHLIFTEEDVAHGVPEQELNTAELSGRADNERWHIRKGGMRFWAVGVTVAIRDGAGKLRGFGKILRDRTDLKELQEALEDKSELLAQADQHKNLFLAKLAHELRNPLVPIQYCADVLNKQGERHPEFLRLADMIERQVKRVTYLVEDLLDITRISKGMLRLSLQPTDFRQIAKRAEETSHPVIEGREHRFQSFLPDFPVMIQADEGRLEQVIVNVLRNAAQYTPRNGDIVLRLSVEGGHAVLRVIDNGIGIGAQQMETLFDLFTQGAPVAGVRHNGLGIGLGLARDLVDLHGGTIQARSEGEGKGSEFIVRLPLAE